MRMNLTALFLVLTASTCVWGQAPESTLVDELTARVPFKYITTEDDNQFKLETALRKDNLMQVRGLLLTANDVTYPVEGCLSFSSDNHAHFQFIRQAAGTYESDLTVSYPPFYDVMINHVYGCEVIMNEEGIVLASTPVFDAAATAQLNSVISAMLSFPEPRTLAQLAVDAAIAAVAPPVKQNRVQTLAVKAVVKTLAAISKATNAKKLAKLAKQLAKLQAKLEKLLPAPTIPVDPSTDEPCPANPEEPAPQLADYLRAGQYSLVEMPLGIPSMEYELQVFDAHQGVVPFKGIRTTRYYGSMGSANSSMYSVFGQIKLNGGDVRYIEKFYRPFNGLAQDFDVSDANVVKTTAKLDANGVVYLTKSSVITELSAALKAAYRRALGIPMN